MADATRLATMNKQIDEQKQATEAMNTQIEKLLQSQSQIDKMIISQQNLEALVTKLVSQNPGPGDRTPGANYSVSGELASSSLTPRPPDPPDLNGSGQTLSGKHQNDVERAPMQQNRMTTRLTKVAFPAFDGTALREWLYKCEQFFELDGTPSEQKIGLASVHMVGKALKWHSNYMHNRFEMYPSWSQYVVDISARFAELVNDPLSELISIKQDGDSVEVFLDKFECAMTRLSLPMPHALSIFLTNLNPQLSLQARQFKVTTVTEAARIAKLHEAALQLTSTKTYRAPFSPYSKPNSSPTYKPSNTTSILPTPKFTETSKTQPYKPKLPGERPTRKYTYEEMQERRTKGLCMFCDEPYTPGHHLKHKRSQIFVMECEEDELEEEQGGIEVEEAEDAIEEFTDEQPIISVNALNGSTTFNCMRLLGQYGKNRLHILVDPGSTHNFLDLKVARGINCKLEGTKPMVVAAALGDKIVTSYKCSDFTWRMQGYVFTTEVRTLPLDSCDLVLGVQWLSTLGPIWWDFSKLKMEFNLSGEKYILRGNSKSSCKVIKGGSLNKLLSQEPQVAFLQLCDSELSAEPEAMLSHINVDNSTSSNDDALQLLLGSYEDLFAEPTELPPFRQGFDHQIPVEVGANPLSQRPYRYNTMQKDVIDKLVREMLSQGTIQYSSSPYASPIVLVKKKDGSWRLCVDYRGLNKQTIKDKYPIPLLEDLLDELGGSTCFSKLDLRAGFHQIRMHPHDVYKTAFKTHAGHYEYLVMPFGLTNAPCTFQGLMNHIFQHIARKFVLVFFDDILVYSPNWKQHLVHLEAVFSVLRRHQLFLKPSKCTFGATVVEYLGHFISEAGVSTDPSKIKAVEQWPTPTSQKQLRSFLGLANYYRRFIQGYSIIARPLTTLLKKDGFLWDTNATAAFEALKTALTASPVLALPNFGKDFVIETDASNVGIGAVLMQENHPICYISRALGPRHQALSVYEKELLAVVHAVQTWSAYLTHRPFIIKTDQKSLKYLLDQKVTTPFQHMWLSKLMGYTYEIQYKQGEENHAADALSRMTGSQLLSITLSQAHEGLFDSIKLLWQSDPHLIQVISEIKNNPTSHPAYSFANGELRRKGKLVVGDDAAVKLHILQWMHDSVSGGHSGRDATLQRIKALFFWSKMSLEVQNYVRNCQVCHRNKYDLAASPGLLQPLPVPKGVWESISMDFIEGLPPSAGKHCILVVVDRLSKNAHFLALSHPYTAIEVAQAYLDSVFKLHGMPQDITSDRDPTFLSEVWRELFRVHGVDLRFSTAYHPQTDGQTEVTNKTLETYLRCMTADAPHTWSKWLPLAEWWYNTTFHSSIKCTPYEVVYGQPPPVHLPYLPGESSSAVVDRSLQKREDLIAMLKFHLLRAQNRMKQYADSHRSQRMFQVGDFVYLKLQPYRQQSLKGKGVPHKLSPRFYGPFRVTDRVGSVAYKLELPDTAAIHNVFHVSQLKLCPNPPSTAPILPQYLSDVGNAKEPAVILEKKMVNRQNKAVTKVLVQWKGEPPEKATWEFYKDFIAKHPTFHP